MTGLIDELRNDYRGIRVKRRKIDTRDLSFCEISL